MGWLGLLAYLFLCLLGSERALEISSLLAEHHGIAIVQDSGHQDIVFTHEHINVLHSGQAHDHQDTAASNPVFGEHKQSHSDHVIHLLKQQEPISTEVSSDAQYLHSIALPMTAMASVDCFLKTVSIQVFPQPPPLQPKIHQFLDTIVLLI